MARIPLDTSGGTTTTLKAAMDDINTMTTELYNVLETQKATNGVLLNGSHLQRLSAMDGATTTGNYITVAVKFTCPAGMVNLDVQQLLDGAAATFTGVAFSLKQDSGNISATITLRSAINARVFTAGVVNQSDNTTPYYFTPGQDYTVHIVASRTSSSVHSYAIFINGVAQGTGVWESAVNPINFSTLASWTVGGDETLTATYDFDGQIHFIYIGAGAASAWAITDPAKLYNAYLGPFGHGPNNLQPLVFLGGQRTAGEWATGANYGYGGDYTVTP